MTELQDDVNDIEIQYIANKKRINENGLGVGVQEHLQTTRMYC